MTWGERAERAIFRGAIAGGFTFFVTLGSTSDAQVLASAAGAAAFSMIATEMGIALNNTRNARTHN